MDLLVWALIFFVVAVIAAVFGFTGIAAGAAVIARVLFFIFVVIFLVLLIMSLVGGGAAASQVQFDLVHHTAGVVPAVAIAGTV